MLRSDSAPRRVLVTGASGFTGRYVADALAAQGDLALALTERPGDPGARSVDLRDRAAVASSVAAAAPDAVIHLAAIPFVAHGDADAMYRTNVVGTRNLLEALSTLPRVPDAILLASSANVYGNNAVEFLHESVPPSPANDYAVSKLAMEYMANLWTEKLPLTLVRPFNYTGIGQAEHFLIPKIVSHFRRGDRIIELGNLKVSRDFQDVRFVAQSYASLLDADSAGSVVNVCSGESVSLLEIVAMMEDIAGYKIDVRVNPAFVRGNEVAKLTGDNSRLRSLIGPLDIIPLRKTLEWMYASRPDDR